MSVQEPRQIHVAKKSRAKQPTAFLDCSSRFDRGLEETDFPNRQETVREPIKYSAEPEQMAVDSALIQHFACGFQYVPVRAGLADRLKRRNRFCSN